MDKPLDADRLQRRARNAVAEAHAALLALRALYRPGTRSYEAITDGIVALEKLAGPPFVY